MEQILTAISVVSTICAIVFGYAAFSRNRTKDTEDEVKRDTTVLSEIGYIKSGVDDIKAEQREQRKTNTEFVSRSSHIRRWSPRQHFPTSGRCARQ